MKKRKNADNYSNFLSALSKADLAAVKEILDSDITISDDDLSQAAAWRAFRLIFEENKQI